MRQGNGTELLGMHDPRSASIGVIYVSPNDDRKSVLAAIITQEKLGRKQVAVVLPNQNKAFQRPVDFDDLKSLKRKLQSQIIFIVQGRPGPAEYARQRRFPVYSTLESYARALRDQKLAESEGKKGWLFGAPRKNAQSASTPEDEEDDTPDEAAEDSNPPAKSAEEEGPPPVVPFVMGTALVGGVETLANAQKQGRLSNGGSHNATSQQDEEDDWDALPPGPQTAVQPAIEDAKTVPLPADEEEEEKPISNSSASNKGPGPSIIELPVRRRTTIHLDQHPNAALTEPDPPSRPARARRNTGKISPGGAGVAAAAGLADAATAANTRSVSASRGSQPPRGNVGGGGSGGGGNRPNRPNNRRVWLIGLILLLLTALIVCGGIAYASPSTFKTLQDVLPKTQPPATVAITPDSQTVTNSYIVTGVQGQPDAAQRQISARALSATASSQPKTVKASGHNQIQGTNATGQLTFLNSSFSNSYTVGTNTPIPAGNVSLYLDTPATIPVANPNGGFGTTTVRAHVGTPGAGGNISALTVNGTCCNASGTVFVKNSQAFSGGQDAKDYMFVQQGDINSVVEPATPQLSKQATDSLKQQLQKGEQLSGSPACTPRVSTDHPPGDTGVNVPAVTVSITMTCKGQAYNQQQAQDLVKDLLQHKASQSPGAGYVLAGDLDIGTNVQSINKGNVSLLVNAKGIWVYQISKTQEDDLARQIAGKSVNEARAILQSQKGIHDATIKISGNTLPADPGQISFVVQNVAGMPTNSTPSSAAPTTGVTPAGTPQGPITPVPGNGNIPSSSLRTTQLVQEG
ncbi:hypothetical protein EPA93_20040 [Ktedonosporobacter rubrisoli]|uniref:Baseplate protein J-like domain-containing protein n=1 Tax=Ktedonosporobacter rubrisoli TaxID=2509675 RepID=A0A4P6JS68_KTERU|nr:hypothetical protein [Ktedonosporobacter rubrisoli]QBD78163.1 hypothetical protein EPA93_20040 [Ktedonosporobacter rubrisoli]